MQENPMNQSLHKASHHDGSWSNGFLDVFHVAGEEGRMCYELEEDQEYTMETKFCVSPLDEFLNIKKQEDEPAIDFFMRMFNIY